MHTFLAAIGGPEWLKLDQILSAMVFSILGVVLFVLLFWLMDKMTPYSFWTELLEEHNSALAIFIGCCAISLGIIVAAAISG